jgi:outer membrane protein assembly factor BamB
LLRPLARLLLAGLAALIVPPGGGRAGDWPGWRGPTGLGVTDERDLPLTWDGKTGTNVLWKAPLPGEGQSSPIAWRDRVLVTGVHWPGGPSPKEYPEHHISCYRADDGKLLWDTQVPPGPWKLTDLRGGYAAPTPATDGERVYALFGSAVLAALDLDGKVVWRKELPAPLHFDVAIAVSPVLYRDTVLLVCDQTDRASRLLAFDRKTGEVRLDVKRPDVGFSHSTPVLADVQGRTQLLVSASNALQGVDPGDGRVLWWCTASGDVCSPTFGADTVYCDSGRGGGPGTAVDATGKGDVTATHVRWKVANVPEGFASPLIVGEHVYRLHNPGLLKCWDLATGKQVYAERLEGVSTRPSPFVTPEGRLYCAGAGKSYVIQTGPSFRVLAVNDLGDGGDASAAVAGGRIFLKGQHRLYAIGTK